MSNNVYRQCPARMEDGRFITRYESSNELTRQIQVLNGIPSSNRFRNFLQQNTDLIMANERKWLDRKYGCHPNIACSEGYYFLNVRPVDKKYQRTNWTFDNSVRAENTICGYPQSTPVIDNNC
jgi:hypothetical protein